jgi:hypothetical protein
MNEVVQEEKLSTLQDSQFQIFKDAANASAR